MVNDLFPIFGFVVVKNPYDLRSQIRFWILPKKRTNNDKLFVTRFSVLKRDYYGTLSGTTDGFYEIKT